MTANVSRRGGKAEAILTSGVWLMAVSLVFYAAYLAWKTRFQPAVAIQAAPQATTQAEEQGRASTSVLTPVSLAVTLPSFNEMASIEGVSRKGNLHTIIPARGREDIISYTVGTGDSVFSIAKSFNIKPESLLWANYIQLKDNPDMLTPGMKLNIPPTDGVLYAWKEGDSLENVAAEFEVTPSDILNWIGNQLDLTDPAILPGDQIMIPGGKREFVQWVIPTIPRGNAGVNKSALGPGACSGGYSGAYGSGSFVWPAPNHFLSGNDYWSGHLGIDLAGATGDPVFASDSGVIVFSGWANGGYGITIMIDHGNGYATLYAHLSATNASCGQSVGQGQTIGYIGSTGNSTGSHLHFEIRYAGGFVNPWYNLPAP